MIFHKLPDDSESLHSALEGIHVSPVGLAVDHLLLLVTPSPDDAAPAIFPVHVRPVVGALEIAVHGGEQVGEVGHLVHVVVSIVGDDSTVRPGPEVTGSLSRVGNDVVLQTVEVNDVDRRVHPRGEPPERRGCHWSD